jgi:hypothetical protein
MASCRPPAKSVDGDLVHGYALAASRLALVVGAAILLQALERLAVAGGHPQLLTALLEVVLVALEVMARGRDSALGTLKEGLAGQQIGDRGLAGCGLELGGACLGDTLVRALELLAAQLMLLHGLGESLLGRVLAALAQGAHALESEPERRTVHGPVVGHAAPSFSVLDGCPSVIPTSTSSREIGRR